MPPEMLEHWHIIYTCQQDTLHHVRHMFHLCNEGRESFIYWEFWIKLENFKKLGLLGPKLLTVFAGYVFLLVNFPAL